MLRQEGGHQLCYPVSHTFHPSERQDPRPWFAKNSSSQRFVYLKGRAGGGRGRERRKEKDGEKKRETDPPSICRSLGRNKESPPVSHKGASAVLRRVLPWHVAASPTTSSYSRSGWALLSLAASADAPSGALPAQFLLRAGARAEDGPAEVPCFWPAPSLVVTWGTHWQVLSLSDSALPMGGVIPARYQKWTLVSR